jgi:hypothetical protein
MRALPPMSLGKLGASMGKAQLAPRSAANARSSLVFQPLGKGAAAKSTDGDHKPRRCGPHDRTCGAGLMSDAL